MITALGVGTFGVGFALVWSAVTRADFFAEVRAALTGGDIGATVGGTGAPGTQIISAGGRAEDIGTGGGLSSESLGPGSPLAGADGGAGAYAGATATGTAPVRSWDW